MSTVVDAFIEIPKGYQNKYEYDDEHGVFRLDRVLYTSMHYPTDYGHIPNTLSEDGDPLDILVLVSFPTFPGCIVPARIVGMLNMEDDKGIDTKILGVCAVDPRFDKILELEDVQAHYRREIEHFFAVYKDLENKKTIMGGWQGREAAVAEVEKARAFAKANGR